MRNEARGPDGEITGLKRPQSKGIVERFHRTLLDEHFRVEGQRTWFETVEEVQTPLDSCLVTYNERRPHQGRAMQGRTPMQVFLGGRPRPTHAAKEPSKRQLDRQPTAA